MGIPTPFDRMGLRKQAQAGGHTWDDFIAYVSCNGYSTTAGTGQELTYSSNLSQSSFTTYAEIPSVDMTLNSSQYIRFVEPTINQGTSMPRSYSLWAAETGLGRGWQTGIQIGSNNAKKCLASPHNYQTTWEICAGGHSYDFRTGVYVTAGAWHHYVQNYFADGTLEMWLDGVMIYSGTDVFVDINSTSVSLGSPNSSTSDYLQGYLASVRLWNRTLTEAEIVELSQEFTPHYQITASDLSFSLYQKYESYSISYSSPMTPVSFEIIEGELPSTIQFNTSTGQFSGKGLTDADHVYNLKVKLTAPNSDPATCNVTIYTYKTARISLYNQSFSFISNKAESKSISYTSDESVTFTIESGTLPAGMTMTTYGYFSSSGTNTSAETQQVVVRATSENNQTGVTATMTLDMQMNAIVLNAQTFKFYTAQGAKTKAVKYSGSLNPVSDAVFSMTGTLPAGVTWDATTGSFTSDGTQSANETASVSVTVSSSNGTSTAAIAIVTIEVHLGEAPIADDYVFYMPMTSISDFESSDANVTVTNRNEAYPVEFTTQDGIDCAYFYGSVDRSLKVNNISNSWPFAGTGRTISLWVKCAALISNQGQGALWYGNTYGNANCIWVGIFGTNEFGLDTYNGGLTKNIVSGELPVVSDLNWHHYAVTVYNNESGKLHGCVYADGVMSIEGGWNAYALDTTVSNVAFIGGYSDQSVWSKTLNGYIAGFRVYDRVLEDSEIRALASEFTPTPSA